MSIWNEKCIISPSLISVCDLCNLEGSVRQLEDAGIEMLHVDILDGHFSPSMPLGLDTVRQLRKKTDMIFDVHLMIQDPIRYVDQFSAAGADYLTVHVEADGDIMGAIDRIRELGKRPGISLNPDTPVSAIEPFIDKVDLVLVMTVQPGFGGQKFRENGPEKIAAIRKMADATGRKVLISVDGGINRDTGRRCYDAGADVLAAGSYLFKQEDMAAEISIWKEF